VTEDAEIELRTVPTCAVHWLSDDLITRLDLIQKIAGFRIRTGLDPDSIGPVDPDPESGSGSGSRRAKITHKSRKNSCFEVLDGLFCELQASSVTWTYFMEA
jgi:hypothetical protein